MEPNPCIDMSIQQMFELGNMTLGNMKCLAWLFNLKSVVVKICIHICFSLIMHEGVAPGQDFNQDYDDN